MKMLVFPQFWMSLKILDEAAKNHTLRIWSAGRLSLFQLVPSCKRIFGQIHRKLAKLSENEKKGEANITGFTSSKSYQASIHKIFHQTSDIDRSNFSWGIEQKVVDILLIENHSLTLEIPNLWEAIPGSSFPNWALGEILKLQRIGASFLSCSNQL